MDEESKNLQPNQTNDSTIKTEVRKSVTKATTVNQDETAHELDPNKLYPYNDIGRGMRFVDVYGHMVRYVPGKTTGTWYLYKDGLWHEETGDDRIRGLAKDVVMHHLTTSTDQVQMFGDPEHDDPDKAAKKYKKFIDDSGSSKGLSNMLREARGDLLIDPAAFDSDPMVLSTPDGYIDLHDGSWHAPDKRKMLSKTIATTVDNTADCPIWKEFLEQTFEGDTDLIEYIQKAVGYSLTGSTSEQVMFILIGDGSNGKSVFNETLTRLMGSYAATMKANSLSLKQNAGGASSDIARLDGIRFVAANESNKGVRLDEALVKELTGGDRMTARELYKSEFEFTPQFKIWLSTNSKPVIRGMDTGIWRRMRVIPFNHRVLGDQVDQDLGKKLLAEGTGILNWALEGLKMWQKDGLVAPRAVKDAGCEYRSEMDVVQNFLDDMCERSDYAYVPRSEVYPAYKEWATEGNEFLMRKSEFNRQMEKKAKLVKVRGIQMWQGIRLSQSSQIGSKPDSRMRFVK